MAHVLQNVWDTNLFVGVGGQIRGSAIQDLRAHLACRLAMDAANSRPAVWNNLTTLPCLPGGIGEIDS